MKKVISFVVVSLLCMTLFSAAASAAAPVIRVGSVSAQPGKSVDVTIALEGNPGLVSMGLEVSYDRNALTLTGVTDAGILGTANHNPVLTTYPYVLSWENDTATSDFTANGVIVTLTFAVASTASGSYPISVSYDGDAGILNYNLSPVSFGAINGVVNCSVATLNVIGISGTTMTWSTNLNGAGKTLTAIAAWYDANGRLLGTSTKPVTATGSIGNQTISVETNAAEYRLFLLDGNSSPVVKSWKSK